MADTIFGEDYLDKITEVHWNNLWLLICSPHSTGVASNHDYSSHVSFPGLAGGTPGFSLIDNGVANQSFRKAPFGVTAKSLQGRLTTEAGAKMTGINAQYDAIDPDVRSGGASVFMKMPTVKGNILKIRFMITNNTGMGSGATMYVFLFDKIPSSFGMVVSPSGGDAYLAASPHPTFDSFASMYAHTHGGLTGTFDFSVNTATLRVDADEFLPGDTFFPAFP